MRRPTPARTAVAAVLTAIVLTSAAAPGAAEPGASEPEAPTTVVQDPVGDATGGSARDRGAADVRVVRYRPPARRGGTTRLSTTFDDLRVYQRGERVRQVARSVLVSPNGRRAWSVTVNNLDPEIRVVRLHGDEPTRIRPRVTGRVVGGGERPSLSAVVSIEWLPVDRVRVSTRGISGGATDDTRQRVVDVR